MEELNKWLVALLVLAILVIGALFWKLIKAVEAQVSAEDKLYGYRNQVSDLTCQVTLATDKIDELNAARLAKPEQTSRPVPSNSKLASAQRKAAARKTSTKTKAPTQGKAAAKAKG